MTIEEVTKYALSLPNAEQAETNDGKWTVFKKGENVFLLIPKNNPFFNYIAICLPEGKGLELQDEFNIVSPSVLRLKGWLDIDIDHTFPVEIIQSWIKESYDLAVRNAADSEMDKYISLAKIIRKT